jgi:hypothetical protein
MMIESKQLTLRANINRTMVNTMRDWVPPRKLRQEHRVEPTSSPVFLRHSAVATGSLTCNRVHMIIYRSKCKRASKVTPQARCCCRSKAVARWHLSVIMQPSLETNAGGCCYHS